MRTSNAFRTALLGLSTVILGACGGESDATIPSEDASSDVTPLGDARASEDSASDASAVDGASADSGRLDGAFDGTVPDGGVDARADGAMDATTDASSDASADVQDASVDGTTEAGGEDAATDGALGDSASADSSADASGDGATCQAGAACTTPGNVAGVFDPDCTCRSCASLDGTGDAECVTAYGSGNLCLPGTSGNVCAPADCRAHVGAPSSPKCASGFLCAAENRCVGCTGSPECVASPDYGSGHVCANGQCVQGSCVSSSDCDATGPSGAGQICSNTFACGACTSDAQCAADPTYRLDGRTICEAGRCVSATCAAASTPVACTSARTCCGGTCLGGSTFSGVNGPGKSCCGPSDCTGTGAPNCVSNVCTVCPAATNNTFYVDPANGVDSGGSGANVGTCAFKTLRGALAFATLQPGVGPTTPARVLVLGNLSTATGETFPLDLPANVTILGTSGTDTRTKRTVAIPPGQTGFTVSGKASVTLSYLTLEGNPPGAVARASRALTVSGTGADVAIDHLDAQNTSNDTILVGAATATAGTLRVGPGVTVTGAGVTGATRVGISVRGSGSLVLRSGAGADPIRVRANTSHGIQVLESGGLEIEGDRGTESVSLSDNGGINLYVRQTPGNVANQAVTVRGLVARGATSHGVRVDGGSRFTLRDATVLANGGSGVVVALGSGGTAVSRDDVSAIDLGSATEAGGNLLQVSLTATGADTRNLGAGLCLALPNASLGKTLLARGNSLVTSTGVDVTCTQAATVVARRSCSTPTNALPTSIGISSVAASGNAIDVNACNYVLP